MGSFDCFCALCSGPLGIYSIRFGSKKEKALARRRKRVENKRRRLLGEEVLHEDSKEWKDEEKREDGVKIGEDGDEHMSDAPSDNGAEVGDGGNEGSHDGEEVDDHEMDGDAPRDENVVSIPVVGMDEGEGEDENENEEDEDENEADGEEWQDEDSNQVSDNDSSASANDSGIDDFDDNASDNWSQASDLSLASYFDISRGSNDKTDSMYSYHENHSYDPIKLKREDVQWTDRCRVLAINGELDGEKRAFISGRGRYNDLFDFNVKDRGNDPRDTGASEHPVYHCYEPDTTTATFPFHEECFKLLTKCLGHKSRQEVDKDVLYAVMQQNVLDLAKNLTLDYGPIEGADQFWECYAGEEWSATDPGPKLGIDEVVKSMLPATLFDRPSTSPLDLSHKVQYDPLTVLPYDILHGIFANLSIKDTLSLITASWHVLDSTSDPAFWRQMIRLHIVPFFSELDSLLKYTTFPNTFDWRGAFQWLDKITKPTFAIEAPLSGIANRRRIWNVCQQLAPLYHEKLNAEAYTEPSDAEAAAILATAKAFHTPVTMFPQPPANETPTITTQFIRSWSEIGHRACDFDTYWADQYGGLIGVSVTFGSVCRVFGSTEGMKGKSMHIKAGEWIKEIRVLIGNIETHYGVVKRSEITGREDERAVRATFIQGITVQLTSGEEKKVKYGNYDRHQRCFTVLSGMHFVGLTGEVGPNGVISRLGLLQAPDPSKPPPSPLPTYTLAQTTLWSSKGAHVYSHSGRTAPIWAHPTKSIHTFPPPSLPPFPDFLQPDMLAHHVLLWAQTSQAYKVLARISTFELSDENGEKSILGLWHKQNFEHGCAEHIGTGGPVPAQLPEKWSKAKEFADLDLWNALKQWDENYMRHFAIDGPGGEAVVEVHVTANRRGFKLVTNRGREGEFGEAGRKEEEDWEVVKAGEGEVVVGLSMCFGNLGGWSETAKMWSHWGLWDLGVVVAKADDERV